MRTSPTITNQEGIIYQQWCAKHGVDPQASAAVVAQYFQDTWKQDVTEKNLELAFPQLKSLLKFHSKAELDLSKATVSFDESNRKKFAEWFESQTFLVKEGEQGFENAANLLEELRGREILEDSILQAKGRIDSAPDSKRQTRVRRPLHYAPTPVKPNPRQHLDDDPTRKTGQFIDPRKDMVRTADGGWRSKNAAEYAAERRAEEAQNKPQSVSIIQSRARDLAETITGANHSETARLRRMFITKPGTSDIDWPATLAAREQAQGSRSVH